MNLGTLSADFLEKTFVEGVRFRLSEILARELLHPKEATADSQRRVLTLPASKLEAVRYFLQTGLFPWWKAESSKADPEAVLMEVLDESPQELFAMLKERCPEAVIKRMERQFSTSALRRIVSILVSSAEGAILPLMSYWVRLIESMKSSSAAIGDVVRFVHACAIDSLLRSPGPACSAVSQFIFSALAKAMNLPPEVLLGRLEAAAKLVLPDASPLRTWLDTAQHLRQPERQPAPQVNLRSSDAKSAERSVPTSVQVRAHNGFDNRDLASEQSKTEDLQDSVIDHVEESHFSKDGSRGRLQGEHSTAAESARASSTGQPPLTSSEPTSESFVNSPIDTVYIENAGLVLLWPFLPRFLEAIGLVSKGRFVSPAAQERSVLILQYLATGVAESPEHLLILNKILCGWPTSESVLRQVEPTGIEMHESDELLRSVVAHWKPLKGTSVDGFRAAFLRREGRLERQEAGWKLTLQRVGYDVVLESLPWAIGCVGLPWMTEPLFVEW